MSKRKRKRRPESTRRNKPAPPPPLIADEPLLVDALSLSGTARDERLKEASEALRLRMEADAVRLRRWFSFSRRSISWLTSGPCFK